MKDSKLKLSAEVIALAKAIKSLDTPVESGSYDVGDALESFLKHLAKVKEALETEQPSHEELEAQRDEVYEKMLQTAAEGKEAGNMRGWLSIPIKENEDGSLTTHVGLVLTSSHARDILLSSLLELLEQWQEQEADD